MDTESAGNGSKKIVVAAKNGRERRSDEGKADSSVTKKSPLDARKLQGRKKERKSGGKLSKRMPRQIDQNKNCRGHWGSAKPLVLGARGETHLIQPDRRTLYKERGKSGTSTPKRTRHQINPWLVEVQTGSISESNGGVD